MLSLEEIRERMGDRNIAEVARRLKVTRSWLSMVISGKVKASDKLMKRLSDYLSY